MKRSACWYTGYVRDIADLMGLRDWQVFLNAAYIDGDHLAEVSPAYGRRVATVSLVKGFDRVDPEEQRYGVVHELMHCHFSAMHWFMIKNLKPGALFEPYNLVMEHGIDAAAKALAPHMPLPYYRRLGRKR